jgi:hypothetical protein
MSKNSADQRDLALHPSSSMRRRLRRSPTASPAPCSAHPHRRIVPMCAPRRGLLRWHSTPAGRGCTAGPHSGNAGVAWACLCVFGRDDPRRSPTIRTTIERSAIRDIYSRNRTRGSGTFRVGHPHCRDICPRILQCDGRQPNFEGVDPGDPGAGKLAAAERPDAIFGYSDLLAIAAMRSKSACTCRTTSMSSALTHRRRTTRTAVAQHRLPRPPLHRP